jgi:hypothetical protein
MLVLVSVGFVTDRQLDQYMALSKKDLQINITLNELYNTHSLLVQHTDLLVSRACALSGCGRLSHDR